MKKGSLVTSGVSMMEILIIISIVSLLIIGVITLLNPQEQIAKARDAQRKNDLNELRKILEDWYSDRGCYPKKTELCFNDVSTNTCEICTNDPASPSLANYTTSAVCDPEHPIRSYLYEIQGDDANCPSSYVIYSKLTSTYQAENDVYSCGPYHGCGPSPSFGYDYLVGSPNAQINVVDMYYCIRYSDQRCIACGTFAQCINQVNNYKMGRQAACYDMNKIYVNPSCN